jgi:hypothetical protein
LSWTRYIAPATKAVVKLTVPSRLSKTTQPAGARMRISRTVMFVMPRTFVSIIDRQNDEALSADLRLG